MPFDERNLMTETEKKLDQIKELEGILNTVPDTLTAERRDELTDALNHLRFETWNEIR